MSTPAANTPDAAAAPARALANGQGGFTLIELVVSMVLLGLVAAFATHAMIDVFNVQQKSGATRVADANAADALDLLGNDLHAAIGPDRLKVDDVGGRPEVLQHYLNSAPGWRPGASQSNLNLRDLAAGSLEDVAYADSTQLWFRANVIQQNAATASTECVAYIADTTGIYRKVWDDWRTCTPTPAAPPATSQMLIQASPSQKVNIFTYRLLRAVGTTESPECVTAQTRAGAGALDWQQKRQVVAVNVDLDSYVQGAQTGHSFLTSTINLRSRLTNVYQFALGCTQWN